VAAAAHCNWDSDIEIISLMVETLAAAGIDRPLLDIGHVGVYRGLVRDAELQPAQEEQLFQAMLRKSTPEVTDLLDSFQLPVAIHSRLAALINLSGDVDVIAAARSALTGASSDVVDALDSLASIVQGLEQRGINADLHVDLTELRGYAYHTGVVFAAYTPQYSHEIARGGRYDDIGAAFGRARPATGYSTDLKLLTRSATSVADDCNGVFVATTESGVWPEIARLRANGERVVTRLPGSIATGSEVNCNRELVLLDGVWTVVSL